MTADDTRTLVETLTLSQAAKDSDADPLSFVAGAIEEAALERRRHADVLLGYGGANATARVLRSRGYEVRLKREAGGVTMRVEW